MNLLYYKHNQGEGNFGDELNNFMWRKIFPEKLFADLDDTAFCGIGSILCDNFIGKNKKFNKYIIFGSGIRDVFYKKRSEQEYWFVRGPITAKCLDLKKSSQIISDAAYCLYYTPDFKPLLNTKKDTKVSFIPHYSSLGIVDWEKICNRVNIKFINPTGGISEILNQISRSQKIIAEAMHGAIVADIMRIPWVRVKSNINWSENTFTSEIKWHDWMHSVSCVEPPANLPLLNTGGNYFKRVIREIVFEDNMANALKYISNKSDIFTHSKDNVYNSIISALDNSIDHFKNTYC